ncbi:acyl-CoA dehydrogenase family protein [Pseudonocardia sp. NPDC049154]|uniref:acyl-CoA dehydrogenase family protein n=1 Tax=Pseudonocardia sp. NPDC049154 TaxID=3155501 RepID=UPI0033DACBC3
MAVELADFTREARDFLDAHARRTEAEERFRWGVGDDRVGYFSTAPAEEAAAAVEAARAWQRTRYENGFGWLTGPEEYGGRGLGQVHALAYDALESEYDVPDTGVLDVIGLGMIGPTILTHGTPELREHYLRRMYSGEVIACQLFSEPAAGSDLAGVTTRAVRDGDGWVVNGQKVWTSIAQHAQVGELLCRTDPDAPKHRGITAFLLDLDTPGVEVRPLRQMTGGAEFNEVFLTDVRIPDSRRLGEVNEGWKVALTTLMNERVTVGGERGGPAAALTPERLTAMLRAVGRESDGALRRDLAALLAALRAARSLNERAARLLRAGAAPGPEGSISKLAFARNLIDGSRFAADVLGPRIIADTGEWGTFAWSELLLSAPALRILGGTEEIMKNILAERVLGLPKEAAR